MPARVIGRSTHELAQVERRSGRSRRLLLRRPVLADAHQGQAAPHPASTWSAPTAELATDKPWFAIGGIDEQRVPEVLAAGARPIVVVRAITGADDPRAAAQRLKARLVAAG